MSSSRGPSRRSPAHGPWRRIPTLPTTPMSSCRPTRTCPANWGTELAHFRSDSPSDGDLEFPSDLWTLKVADSGNNGGKIVISSAHIEASIFHTAIGDAGMTECESESRDWLARAYHVHILTLFFLSTMNCNRLQQLRLPHSVRHRWYLGHRPSRV